MQLKNSYNIEEKNMYLMMMPLTIAGFAGTLIFVTKKSFYFRDNFLIQLEEKL